MTLWVLDTDSLSLLERGNPKIQERLRQVNADSVAISIITAEEKMKGRLAAINSLSESNVFQDYRLMIGRAMLY
jgi:tRNA(fMet)-specific endonuclease VapC